MRTPSRDRPVPPTLVVLAAGLGSRFGGPKQVVGFGPSGETLLELNLYDAVSVGVRQVVLVTRRELDAQVGDLLRRLPTWLATDVRYQDEEPMARRAPARARPWGTAHAVLAAGPTPGGALVLNADDLYGQSAMAAVLAVSAQPIAPRPLAVMAGYRLDRTLSAHGGVSRGICELAADGTLARITEVGDLRRVGKGIMGNDESGRTRRFAGSAMVSLNLWALDEGCRDRLEARFAVFLSRHGEDEHAEFRLPDFVRDEIAAGARVRVAPTDAEWIGVTHADDTAPARTAVQRFFDEGRYPSPLFQTNEP